jgi:ubiquinone/menaquinone biosynthesis C-methylase UbiE
MKLLDGTVHKRVHKRLLRDTLGRTQRVNLVRVISSSLPDRSAQVLDIGCGNGLFSHDLMAVKPNLNIVGVETKAHPDCHIKNRVYDGENLPFPDKSFDYALLINVLHHTDDPAKVLSEASRVARHGIVIKDHYANSRLDFYTLVAMERIGNAFIDISQPYNFFSERQWDALFQKVGLRTESIRKRFVSYNAILDFLFGRNLHFIAKVACPGVAR